MTLMSEGYKRYVP